MRLKELYIDAFGLYTNFQLDFNLSSSPFTIIYGPNEAGKSTLHAFLRFMLFGHQLKGMPPYEYLQGRLSGRLTLEDETGKLFFLDRNTPPKQGKITLLTENGTELGASALATLLGHVSAPLFTNIFAFSHQELQRLETLQGEEIASFLYSAALGNGANQLVEIEKKMAKQSAALFRPRATNPLINRLIKEIEETELQVEKRQSKLSNYSTVKQHLAELNQKLAEKHKHRETLSVRRRLYEMKAKVIEHEQALAQVETERKRLEQLPRTLLAQRDKLHTLFYQEESMVELEKNIELIDQQLNTEQQKIDVFRQQDQGIHREINALRDRLNRDKLLCILGLGASCLLPFLLLWWLEHPLASVLLFIGLLWLTKEQYASWKKDKRKESDLSQRLVQLRADLEQSLSNVAQLEEQRNKDIQVWNNWKRDVLILAANIVGLSEMDPYLALNKLKDRLANEEQIEAERNSIQMKQEQLLQELEALRQTLANEELSIQEMKILEELNQNNIAEQIADLEQKYTAVLQDIERVAKECGKLETEIELLANEEALSKAQQILEEKKAELQREANKWAVFSLAEYLCQQVRHIYEVERQPEVLKHASHFFEKMTLGRYKQIIVPFAEKSMMVIRRDNQRLSVDQLSQGTREQLYLAMRFAVIQDYEKIVSLPLIMDDIFVNFDRERVKEALYGLVELAERHQIIYFTCHEHMLSLIEEVFGKVNIVELSGIKISSEIKG